MNCLSLQTIQMHPWIIPDQQQNNSTSAKYSINMLKNQPIPTNLISLLSLHDQMLPLIANLSFPITNKTECSPFPIAYISDQILINSSIFQIAYLPYRQSKQQNQWMQNFGSILREQSDVIIGDINCSGSYRFKQKENMTMSHLAKQYVVINNKEIYQVEMNDQKIDLVKKLEQPTGLWDRINPQFTSKPEISVRINRLEEILHCYLQKLQFLLNSNQNWSFLVSSVLQNYRTAEWLQLNSAEFKKISNQGGMLSITELNNIQQTIHKRSEHSNPLRASISKKTNQKIMNDIRAENQKNLKNYLTQLKNNFNSFVIVSQYQMLVKKEAVLKLLQQHNISAEHLCYVTIDQQKRFLQDQIWKIKNQNEVLEGKLVFKEQEMKSYNVQLDQCKSQIVQLTNKISIIKQIGQELIKSNENLEREKLHTKKLQFELESHYYIEAKNKEGKNEFERKYELLKKEKEGLLVGLQQLTTQNLSLLNEKSELQKQIQEFKDKICESQQIESRALRCIENEAEIKVRLDRYENYVRELKVSMVSFKRLEIDKFNYILEHNYREYEQLQQSYASNQKELKKAWQKIEDLQQTLQSEKLRLKYYQKIVLKTLQTETIPEVSEQNSATDRQIIHSN